MLPDERVLDFLLAALSNHPSRKNSLSDRERCIIAGVLQRKTYQQMAVAERYTEGSLQNAASALFKDLTVVLKQKVNQQNFLEVLAAAMDQKNPLRSPLMIVCQAWLRENRAQVVCLEPLGQSKNSSLTTSMLERYSRRFDQTIMVHVWQCESFDDVLTRLLTGSGFGQIPELVRGKPGAIEAFLEMLEVRSMLLVVEYDAAAVGCPPVDLLLAMLQRQHRCCLVLVNPAAEVLAQLREAVLSESKGTVRSMSVTGQDQHCHEVLDLYLR